MNCSCAQFPSVLLSIIITRQCISRLDIELKTQVESKRKMDTLICLYQRHKLKTQTTNQSPLDFVVLIYDITYTRSALGSQNRSEDDGDENTDED